MSTATSPREPNNLRGNARGQRARRRLLDAALEAFADRGFHGVSTREIAEAAHLTPGALYAHYDSKESLLFALSLDGHQQVHRLVRDVLAVDRSPSDQLHAVVAAYASWHAREHVTARVVQYEMAALNPAHYEQIAEIRRKIAALVGRSVRRGVRAGEFSVGHLGMTTLAILSLGVDVARWYRDDGPWTPERIGAEYGAYALRLVGYRTDSATKGPLGSSSR